MLPARLRVPLLGLSVFAIVTACHGRQEPGFTGAYVGNGIIWAYGSVELSDLDAPGEVMLKRTTPDQSVNSPSYDIFGAVVATGNYGGASEGVRDLAYVDYHPTDNTRALAYAYELDYEPRCAGSNLVDIYAVLKKAGPSYYGRQKVLLGTANFQDGGTLVGVALAGGVKLSLISDGVFQGQWALHYPDIQLVDLPWETMCPQGIAQLPGQNASQNPGQFNACRPQPAAADLCNGDPTQAACRPSAPVPQPVPTAPVSGAAPATPTAAEPAKSVTGLSAVDPTGLVYTMDAAAQQAQVTFTSAVLKSTSDDDNAQKCARSFYAIARSDDREINSVCDLKPAPATSPDGRLTCALTLSFDQPETYLERICNVTAVFRGTTPPDEIQHVQILKK
jgi:hypothetical protein